MAITRVEFSTDGITYSPIAINPVSANLQDSDNVSSLTTLDGPTIEQLAVFDSRPRTLVWNNLPIKAPYEAMVNTLKSYKNIGPIWMKLNTIGLNDTNPFRVKVTNVVTTIKDGAGPSTSAYSMTWATIILTYVRITV